MGKKKNFRILAEQSESKAKFIVKRVYQKKRFSKVEPRKEIEKLYDKAYKGFQKAGDIWAELGRFNRAKKNYQSAIEYATVREEEKIKSKLRKLPTGRGIEKYFTLASLAIGSFTMALFFISLNLTGYAIGVLSQENSRFVGTSLFILGLVFTFFYFKNKK